MIGSKHICLYSPAGGRWLQPASQPKSPKAFSKPPKAIPKTPKASPDIPKAPQASQSRIWAKFAKRGAQSVAVRIDSEPQYPLFTSGIRAPFLTWALFAKRSLHRLCSYFSHDFHVFLILTPTQISHLLHRSIQWCLAKKGGSGFPLYTNRKHRFWGSVNGRDVA